MKNFMDRDFILTTDTAKKLYHDYAAKKPVLDYHCHINPKEIAEDRKFDNITQLWLAGDHYKWRLMRANAVDEEFITGKASDRDKFQKWAETIEKAIGNPLHHWSHLELRKYFNYQGVLNSQTAGEVWDLCNKKLQEPNMSVRGIIKHSNVTLICTTDDPADSLEWHQKIKDDKNFDVQVLPAWRPDKAMGIEKPAFAEYIGQLSKVSGVEINSFESFKTAFKKRLDFFNKMGCRASDHALDFVMYYPSSEKEVETIFAKRLKGQEISKEEELKYKTAFMVFAGKEYAKVGWVMELHASCKRNNNSLMFKKLGPDTGFDCSNNYGPGEQLADFLNSLETTNELPKTIIYSLNPNDDDVINTICGCFQNSTALNKVQQGSAWWFNDHKPGMIKQMIAFANVSLLSNFVGMLTDSRSFVSYTRHEYFRRILCEIIGNWVENGEYPDDIKALAKIVEDVSYDNAVKYFGFKL